MEFTVEIVPTPLFEESSLQQARNSRPEIKAEKKIYRPLALMHRRYVGRIVLKAANHWLSLGRLAANLASHVSQTRALKAICG